MPRPPAVQAEPVALLRALRPLLAGLPLGLQERGATAGCLSRILERHPEQEPAVEDRLSMAANLALLCFQQFPFDPLWANSLSDINRSHPFLDPRAEALAQRLGGVMVRPDPVEGYEELLASDQHEAVLQHLPALVADPAEGLFRLGRSWDWLLRLGRAEEAGELIRRAALTGPAELLRPRLLAEWAFHYQPAEAALDMVLGLDPEMWWPWTDILAAELENRLGDPGGSARRLAGVWRAMPWHPHLTLVLHHRLLPPKTVVSEEEMAATGVLLYSWNKPDLLAQTLESLAESHIGPARVVVLDNGSDRQGGDPMGRTLELGESLFAGRFETVRLPVNVGAPAARNWLLALPSVRAMRHAAFLDDDVLLPADWLPRMLAQAGRMGPEYGAVGCRIVSAAKPQTMQSADYHLLPPQPGHGTFQDWPENLAVFDNAAGSLDLGLFSYSRPARSVSGCCHLLNMEGVRRHGGFNLAFTPTQFDDLERDLRLGLAGMDVHYLGDVAVGHVQHSSLARAKSLLQAAQVLGNKIKLEGMFTEDQLRGLAESGLDRLWDDLLAKTADLSQS